jgi:cytochrome c oxidase subunit 2
MKRGIGFGLVAVAFVAGLLFQSWRTTKAVGRMKIDDQLISLKAKKFEFTPSKITVKKGVPVVIELSSEDRSHGFNLPEFKVRADVQPGSPSKVRFTPDKAGEFDFSCDVFCGDGHEDMNGKLVVTDD